MIQPVNTAGVRRVVAAGMFFALLAALASSALTAERPRIGLALSGGGARGAAHIGVIRVLEQMSVPIDRIAGTSMGAIVGGLYALGMSPDDIERAIAEIDWNSLFQDEAPRPERRMLSKLDDRNYLIKSKPGVIERERKVNLAPALIQGQKLDLALRRYTLPASTIDDFDRLRIPFRAVATDVVTGEAVVLGTGDLATAMRASMAVPAVFAPVEIGDRLLVDGGLAMNLPIAAVRAMGADIVIAVDVGGPRRGREEIGDVLKMLDQVASLVTWRNTAEQIATLRRRDLLIVPPLEHEVIASDFDKMMIAVALGVRGAEAKHAELARLALPPERYAAYRAQHQPPRYRPPVIDEIRIENRSRLADAVLRERIAVTPGVALDPPALEQQLGQIYDQDRFESVRYHLEPIAAGGTALVVTAKEKSWGTSSLQAGLDLSSSSRGDSRFNIGLAYTFAPWGRLNGEWRTALQIGEEPGFFTQLYRPLDPGERWFISVGLAQRSEKRTLFAPEEFANPLAEYRVERFGGEAQIGYNFGDWGRMTLSYYRDRGTAEARIGAPYFPTYRFDSGEIELRFLTDTLDSLYFPRHGWYSEIFTRLSRPGLGASAPYDQAGFSLLHAYPGQRGSLLTGLSFGISFGDQSPPHAQYRLGGFLDLSGFDRQELSGAHFGLAQMIYLYDLGTTLVKTFAGGALEAGNVWAQRSDIRFDRLRFAATLFLGADTLIGPFYLGYGHADGGHGALYLFLGWPWQQR